MVMSTLPIPERLSLHATMDTRLHLVWHKSPEADVDRYEVFRDDSNIPLEVIDGKNIAGITFEMTDLALTNGRVYSYKIRAVDIGGHNSDLSTAIQESPQAGPEWSQ